MLLAILYGFFIIFSLIIMAVIFYKKMKQKDELEMNKTPLYEEKCTFEVSGFGISAPFARLTMYKDFLIISSIVKIIIRYEDIKYYSRKKILLHKLFLYLAKEYKGFLLTDSFNKVTIWPGDINKVCQVLDFFKVLKKEE